MKTSVNSGKFENLDYTGIFFSMLCLVHCLFLPFLISIAPTLTHQLENEWVHLGLLVILIPVALISLLGSQQTHKKPLPLLTGCFGVTLLLSAVIVEKMGIEGWESRLTLLGSITLISAHILNLKYQIQSRP